MIRSMTGFGEAERAWRQWHIRVEARSVNQSDLKLSVRLPDMLRVRESDLNPVIRGKIHRGHLYLSVTCDLAESAIDMLVDKQKLGTYIRLVRDAAEAEGTKAIVDVGSLMALPGVVNDERLPAEERDGLWEQVVSVVDEALGTLVQMRKAEGASLRKQLMDLAQSVRLRTEAVRDCVDQVLQDYRDRLAARVTELLNGAPTPADEGVIAREVAILAERSDVSEEITRMHSHLDQFDALLEGDGEPVGKAMEFLTQEMLREANTTAAKLPSAEKAQDVMGTKSDITKLREQVRNVE